MNVSTYPIVDAYPSLNMVKAFIYKYWTIDKLDDPGPPLVSTYGSVKSLAESMVMLIKQKKRTGYIKGKVIFVDYQIIF